MNIGNQIQKIRTLKGFSQASVAHILGISQRQLSRIENNQSDIKFSVLDNICAALEIKMEELLNFDEQSLFHIPQRPIDSNNNKSLSQVLIKQYEKRIQHLEKKSHFYENCYEKRDNSKNTYYGASHIIRPTVVSLPYEQSKGATCIGFGVF